MSLLSSLKAGAARVATAYSIHACPWEIFDRPALPKTLRPMASRESECWADLQSFWFFNEIIAHRIPQTRVPPLLDTGDQATWQGVYLAMLCFKYARAKSDSLAQLIANALNGCYQHQYFHGEGKPRLIRGYDRRNENSWQDDASNDSLTGHFFGLYMAFRFGPQELRGKALQLINGIATEIIENNCCLIKADKTPTTYGKLINGPLTDPLNMTLCLAILTTARHYGLHGDAAELCFEIQSKYGTMVPYGKMILGTIENWNDDHRAAIHLAILAMEDASPTMRDLTARGLSRLWTLTRERGNIWVNALIALGIGDTMPLGILSEMQRQARIVLCEYELLEKRWDLEKDWRGEQRGDVWMGKTIPGVDSGFQAWTPRIITVAGHQRSTQPIPSWCDGAQDFIWQRHRYSVNDWMGQTSPSQRFNGGDFLAAYHLSILTGILQGNE